MRIVFLDLYSTYLPIKPVTLSALFTTAEHWQLGFKTVGVVILNRFCCLRLQVGYHLKYNVLPRFDILFEVFPFAFLH